MRPASGPGLGAYESKHDPVVVRTQFCCGYLSGIEAKEDGEGCNDQQDGDCDDKLTTSTFDEARYGGDAETARHRKCHCVKCRVSDKSRKVLQDIESET